jgi:hypothetical protein
MTLEPTAGEHPQLALRAQGDPRDPRPPESPIKVVRGNPTPEELAAALAVVRARAVAVAATASAEGVRDGADEWADPARIVPRRLPFPGPAAWRTAYWPG